MAENAPFVVSRQARDVWHDLGNIRSDGSRVRVKFTNQGMVVQRILDHAIWDAAKAVSHLSRDIHKNGTMIGDTQKHWRPAFSLPAVENAKWTKELGPYRHNKAAWHRRANSSDYRDFKMCEGKI